MLYCHSLEMAHADIGPFTSFSPEAPPRHNIAAAYTSRDYPWVQNNFSLCVTWDCVVVLRGVPQTDFVCKTLIFWHLLKKIFLFFTSLGVSICSILFYYFIGHMSCQTSCFPALTKFNCLTNLRPSVFCMWLKQTTGVSQQRKASMIKGGNGWLSHTHILWFGLSVSGFLFAWVIWVGTIRSCLHVNQIESKKR